MKNKRESEVANMNAIMQEVHAVACAAPRELAEVQKELDASGPPSIVAAHSTMEQVRKAADGPLRFP